MKMRRLTRAKAIWAVILAAAVVCVGYLPVNNAFAGTSTVTVNVGSDRSWGEVEGGTTFTFNLYKVGEYDRYVAKDDSDAEKAKAGKVIYKLNKPYDESGAPNELVGDPASYEADMTSDSAINTWLNAANTLATYANGKTPDKTDTVTFGGSNPKESLTFSGLSDGLYLLKADNPVEVGDTLWTPQPMLINVLNGDKTINFSNPDNNAYVKIAKKKIVFNHTVSKEWLDDELSDYIRPNKIAVEISYGKTVFYTAILEKSEEASKNYIFNWKHKIEQNGDISFIYVDQDGKEQKITKTPNAGDAGWTTRELRGDEALKFFLKDAATDAEKEAIRKEVEKLNYYTTIYLPKDITSETDNFSITNTLAYKKLELTKTIDGYDGDGDSVAFSFLIEGYDGPNGTGNKIYTNHLGIVFNKNDGLSKPATLDFIPYKVASIKITEEYSGNYELVEPIVVTEIPNNPAAEPTEGQTDESAEASASTETTAPVVLGWKAAAENRHTGHGPKGGVVNQFRHGQDKPTQVGPKTTDNTQGEE